MTIRKEAVRHIIGRCGFALLAAVLVLFGWKVALSAIQSRILPPDAERLLNDWIDQTAMLTAEEQLEFLKQHLENVADKEENIIQAYHLNDDVWLQAVGQFHQQVNNRRIVSGWIRQARTGSGFFGSTLPNNFIERQMDYAGLSEPGLVHETRWQTFFYLRDNRMFFLIVFALIIIVQGPRAESGFDRLQQTLPGGKNLRRREMLLLLIFLIFLLIAEFGLDLWLSGIGLDSRDLMYSIQSILDFQSSLAGMTLGDVLIWLPILDLAALIFTVMLTRFVLLKTREIKRTVVICIGLTLFLNSLFKAVPELSGWFLPLRPVASDLFCHARPLFGGKTISLAFALLIAAGLSVLSAFAPDFKRRICT